MTRLGRVAVGLLGSVGLVAALGAAAWVGVGRYDFGALAAGRASTALGRGVAITTLRVTPGRWLRIEAGGMRLDNTPGGTRPAMAQVARLVAEVDALTLLHGPAVVRQLEIDGLRVLLERGEGGARNWRFGVPKSGAPDDRSWFPTLLDARMRDSEVVFRTSGGTALPTRLDDVAIRAADDAQPVSLVVDGAYNGVPVRLTAGLDPISVLRRPVAYGTKLHFALDGATLDFDGTMAAPLDVDGAAGTLTLDAASARPLLAMAGVQGGADLALKLTAGLERTDGDWALTGGTGALNGSEILAASLRLLEGAGGKPDQVSADLAFERLDLNELLGAGQRGKRTGADIPLRVDPAPGTLIDLNLTANTLEYAGLLMEDAVLAGALAPGRVTVRDLSLTYLGARAQASGQVGGGQVSTRLLVGGADVQRLRQALGFGAIPVQGRLSAQAEASATGPTLNTAFPGARVSAVVALAGGSIAREVIAMASTDVRLLFRQARGTTPVGCLLMALDMRGGVGTLSPLRVRAGEGTIAGFGRFDLYRRVLDLSIGSEARTTSAYALDIPVRVSGPFAKPDVRPAQWSAAGRASLASMDAMGQLPPGLRAVAQRSGCSRR